MDNPKTFSAQTVLKNAWHQVKGAKGAILFPLLINLLIIIGVILIVSLIAIRTGVLSTPTYSYIPLIITIIILIATMTLFLLTPLFAGMEMTALKRARNQTIGAGSAFHYWHHCFALWFSMLVLVVSCTLTFFLYSHFLSLLVYLFFQFNLLSVSDKKKGGFAALIYSAELIVPHWGNVLIPTLVVYLMITLSLLPGFLTVISCSLALVQLSGVVVSLLFCVWVIPYATLIKANIFHQLSD